MSASRQGTEREKKAPLRPVTVMDEVECTMKVTLKTSYWTDMNIYEKLAWVYLAIAGPGRAWY